jgi:hypothetical protein
LRLAGSGDAYVLVTVMHRLDKVPAPFRELIAEGGRPVVNPPVAEGNIVNYLASLGDVSPAIDLAHGTFVGIQITVRSWLCGPILPLERWARS